MHPDRFQNSDRERLLRGFFTRCRGWVLCAPLVAVDMPRRLAEEGDRWGSWSREGGGTICKDQEWDIAGVGYVRVGDGR